MRVRFSLRAPSRVPITSVDVLKISQTLWLAGFFLSFFPAGNWGLTPITDPALTTPQAGLMNAREQTGYA